MIFRSAFAFLLFLSTPLVAVELPDAVTLAQAKDNYAGAIRATKAANLAKRESLHKKYDGALERLQVRFQSRSDIQNAIAVDKERDRFAKEQAVRPSPVPEIADLQEILGQSLAPFDRRLAASLDALRLRQVGVLTTLQSSLARLGSAREAAATGAEITRLQAETAAAGPAPAKPSSAAAARPEPLPRVAVVPPTRTIRESDINKGAEIAESASLEPGTYRLPRRVLIKRSGEKKKIPSFLYSPPGTTFRESFFLVGLGCSLYAHGNYFKDSKLRVDTQGSLTARDCLLENCTFDKAGNWISRRFGSKWHLENSVISGSFFPEIKSKTHGLEIRYCTFHRVDFAPFKYLEDSDAGVEATHRWRTIDACKFVDCKISMDLLACTTNCLFENCTFEIPEKRLPGEQPIEITIYTLGGAPKPDFTNKRINLTVQPAASLSFPVGSNIDYKINGKTLSFAGAP